MSASFLQAVAWRAIDTSAQQLPVLLDDDMIPEILSHVVEIAILLSAKLVSSTWLRIARHNVNEWLKVNNHILEDNTAGSSVHQLRLVHWRLTRHHHQVVIWVEQDRRTMNLRERQLRSYLAGMVVPADCTGPLVGAYADEDFLAWEDEGWQGDLVRHRVYFFTALRFADRLDKLPLLQWKCCSLLVLGEYQPGQAGRSPYGRIMRHYRQQSPRHRPQVLITFVRERRDLPCEVVREYR
jgi:hypothetical protein